MADVELIGAEITSERGRFASQGCNNSYVAVYIEQKPKGAGSASSMSNSDRHHELIRPLRVRKSSLNQTTGHVYNVSAWLNYLAVRFDLDKSLMS